MSGPLDELRDRLHGGGAVLLLGSEVAFAVKGDPALRWEGLLATGIRFCVEYAGAPPDFLADWATDGSDPATYADRRIKPDLWEVAAGQIVESLVNDETNPRLLGKWFRTALAGVVCSRYDPSLTRPQATDLIGALAELGTPILTTNYDTVIDDALEAETLTWMEPDRVQRALRREEPRAVVHVHGVWSNPQSIMLSQGQFGRLGEQDGVKESQLSVSHGSTLVCIGLAGAHDPALKQVVAWLPMTDRWSTDEHYLIVGAQYAEGVKRLARGRRVRVLAHGDTPKHLDQYIYEELLGPPAKSRSVGAAENSSLHPGVRAIRHLERLGGAPRPDDAVAALHPEAAMCLSELGRLNGLLRHFIDRTRLPADWSDWTPLDQAEFHAFYSRAATIVAKDLSLVVSALGQTAPEVRARAGDLSITVELEPRLAARTWLCDYRSRLDGLLTVARNLRDGARGNLEIHSSGSGAWRRVQNELGDALSGAAEQAFQDLTQALAYIDMALLSSAP